MTFPDAVIESLCLIEILRSFGFRDVQIAVTFDFLPTVKMAVTDGVHHMVIDVGHWVLRNGEQPQEIWDRAVAAWNHEEPTGRAAWSATFEASDAHRKSLSLFRALRAHGFALLGEKEPGLPS